MNVEVCTKYQLETAWSVGLWFQLLDIQGYRDLSHLEWYK